ncbi:phosphoprotein phosphatase [Glutamicibacter sp. FBE19]|uniref:phosphoprotein phosphatase n=1 Tax=Glutamicibacter sp. FBE19 TaxID=2761534 RepID=UPI0018967D50|nr:phosphoprotein phosphatase [Glutamicibacter sp. FBE19]MBF6671553.1 phosphoprotein phosphatase [Glutamicibacter sp. FBE19]
MSRIHYWSDLHLGHEFVAKLREFKDGPAMKFCADQPDPKSYGASTWHDHHIQEVWMENVKPKDHIWILGDISGGRNEDYALDFIGHMPGIKHLIAGNHDSVSSIHRNAWKRQGKFLKVFASVQDFARHKVMGQDFMLSHYPYIYNGDHGDRDERYSQYRLADYGIPLVHGHVHDEWDQKLSRGFETPMLNVGVDHRFDRPANTEDIIDWLRSEEVIK